MVGFVDETFRDGPQSLWATRMKTEHMLGATEWINRAGFRRVCVTSGAAFETAVKFLRDDPWERLRLLKAYLPDASIDVLMRSRNLFGWARYPDEVVEVLFRCLHRAGTQWVKVFDGLNCMSNIAAHFRIARNIGLKTSGMLSFSVSPAHTDEHYVAKSLELIGYGVDSITLADPAGILTGERAHVLLASLKAAARGRVPIDRNVLDRILAGRPPMPVESEAMFGERILEKFKRERGPFRSDENMLLHLFYGREHVEALAREKSTLSGRPALKQPLRMLIDELARRGTVETLKLEKGPLKLSLRFS